MRSRRPANVPPRWMLTFADMMSQLLCLFILLLSFSNMDIAKYKLLAENMQSAFGYQWLVQLSGPYRTGIPSIVGPSHGPVPGVREPPTPVPLMPPPEREAEDPLPPPPAERFRASVTKELAEEILSGQVELEALGSEAVLRFAEAPMFPTGTDSLQSSFLPVLDKVARILSETPGVIQVAGHTDDLPIRTERYRSNWDLSSARAATVVHYLLEHSTIRPERIVALGHADSRPLVHNTSPENRARNRRVEIRISLR
jgi:chemotaxis protein MotB